MFRRVCILCLSLQFDSLISLSVFILIPHAWVFMTFFSERERCLHTCPMEGDAMRKGETLDPRRGRCLPKTLEETVSIGVPSWKSSGWNRDCVMTFLSSYSPENLKMQIRET